MIYQLMFAIITPALISGAFAERMKFSAMLLFMVLWSLLVYCPDGPHGVGQGRSAERQSWAAASRLSISPAAPWCTSPPASRRWSARCIWASASAYPKEPMPPHSVVLSFIGACLLWVGWFGFNAGSALSAGSLATSAFVATHFAAAAAALGWAVAEWIRNGKPSVLGAISGAVAGLVAITPASGFVGPMPALLIGFIAGVFCYFMVAVVKARLGYDDSLDAFGVHGAGGTMGALLTGVFATSAINPIFKDAQGHALPVGMIDGNFRQLGNQAIGISDRDRAGRGRHLRHSAGRRFHHGRASVGRRRSAGSRPDATWRRRLLLGSLDAVRAQPDDANWKP